MIETLLPNGRKTDRLAFGCAGIGGSLDYSASRRVLLTAWEAGFRHFDTAPSYGLGMSEVYLGRFLKEVGAENATITTKAGIGRPTSSFGLKRLLLPIARPILNQLPSVRRSLGERTKRTVIRRQFRTDLIQASLEESLRALNVEQIDVFLMHELTVDDLTDELLLYLERVKLSGKIGSVGIGSRRASMEGVLESAPDVFDFYQTNWDWDDTILPRATGRTANCHGVLRFVGLLKTKMSNDHVSRAAAYTRLAKDPDDPFFELDILLSMALADTENGFVIAQSSQLSHISEIRIDKRINDPVKFGEVANGIFRH